MDSSARENLIPAQPQLPSSSRHTVAESPQWVGWEVYTIIENKCENPGMGALKSSSPMDVACARGICGASANPGISDGSSQPPPAPAAAASAGEQ